MKRPLLTLLALQASTCLAFSPRAAPSATAAALGRPPHRAARVASPSSRLSASPADDGDDGPLNFLQGLFSSPSNAAAAKPAPAIPDVVVDSDYTLAVAFAAVGLSLASLTHGVGGVVAGGLLALLASLFAVQATRLRFVFDADSFELKAVDAIGSEDLTDSGENIVVGGANRWRYDAFVNYDFFPSVAFPILVYFKETQTSDEGQIHFFPAIANVQQLNEQFELRGCASVRDD